MLCKTRFLWLWALAGVMACFEDPGQGENSSTSTASDGTGTPTTSADPATTSDGDGTGGTQTGDTVEPEDTTVGPPEDTTETETEGDTVTTGDPTGATGEPTTGTSTGEICEPITEDASGIGAPCQINADCLPGYTCQTFNGFVQEMTCQILCDDVCECPMGLSCSFTEDKVTSWFQCTL